MDRWILYSLIVLVLAYIFLPEFFPAKEYKPDQTLVNRIDSLEQKNKELEFYIMQFDSLQFEFDQQIIELNTRIDNNKGKTTIIREVYKDKGNSARKFTPSQVDSFFKDRYNF
jgi:hypothetical protein